MALVSRVARVCLLVFLGEVSIELPHHALVDSHPPLLFQSTIESWLPPCSGSDLGLVLHDNRDTLWAPAESYQSTTVCRFRPVNQRLGRRAHRPSGRSTQHAGVTFGLLLLTMLRASLTCLLTSGLEQALLHLRRQLAACTSPGYFIGRHRRGCVLHLGIPGPELTDSLPAALDFLQQQVDFLPARPVLGRPLLLLVFY